MNINHVVIIFDSEIGSNLAMDAEAAGFAVYKINVREDPLQEIFNHCGKPVKRGYRHGCQKNLSKHSYALIMKNTDMVIEYTEECLNHKKKLFKFLDQMCPPRTIFATNSYSFNLTMIAALTKRPGKVLGLHINAGGNNVDIIKNVATTNETISMAKVFVQKIDKKAMELSDYTPELIHHFIMPMINEAAYFLVQGVSNPENIDNLMRIGSNLPIGPLALADLIGLDDCLSILEKLYANTGDSKFYPCSIFREYIQTNRLGCKTGQGFYVYKSGSE